MNTVITGFNTTVRQMTKMSQHKTDQNVSSKKLHY